MNVKTLILELQSQGVRFEPEGKGFRVLAPRGLITPELQDELTEHKPEILALLSRAETQVMVSYPVGNCPHCKQPLLVFTHALDDEVWIQCPTQAEIFKALKHEAQQWCRDCGERLPVIAGRCAECIQRVMLVSDKPCPHCGGARFWRYRAHRSRPAGFAWHCASCEEPTGKVAIYEISQ